jgi:cytochrome c peroxidase
MRFVLLLTALACSEAPDVQQPSANDAPVVLPDTDPEPDLRVQLEAMGVTAMPAPPAQPEALVELGRLLAFDKVFSGDHDVSCMTCHQPTMGTSDDRRLPVGVGGEGLGADRVHPDDVAIPRNAPPMYNLHAMDSMFWDGRLSVDDTGVRTPAGDAVTDGMLDVLTLGPAALQALFPVTSRHEMRGERGSSELGDRDDDDFAGIWADLIARALAIPEYAERFAEAYPDTAAQDLSWAHAAQAIAAFEVTAFDASDTPFDRYLRGDDTALSPAAKRGAALFFGEAGCVACHSGVALSDESFHNTGMPQFGPGKGAGEDGTDDVGRFAVTQDFDDVYAFRTPPLRNVALSAPYGHTGQFLTLESFVGHYVDVVDACESYDASVLDPALQASVRTGSRVLLATLDPDLPTVSPDDVSWLVAFLESLTDPRTADDARWEPDTVPSGLPVGH